METFIPPYMSKKLNRLTNGHAQTMNALGLKSYLLIEGNAGTGKTLLAGDCAKRRAIKGDRGLYLAFNKNLANNINSQVGEIDNLKIISIHTLFGDYVKVDLERMKTNAQKYFSDILPEDFLDYVSSLTNDVLEPLQFAVNVLGDNFMLDSKLP